MLVDRREDYVDALKGFAILWVIWWHAPHPEFISPYFHVPLFFFISGFFFKAEGSLIPFIKKKINTIFVPIMFFLLFGYAVKLFLHAWDTKQINTFDFGSIFDIFVLGHTWTVNMPLWFLLALFVIQILMFVFCTVTKVVTKNQSIYFSAVLIISFGLFCLSRVILPGVERTYFELKLAMSYILIFSLGYVFGKRLMVCIANNAYAIGVGMGALCVVIVYRICKVENSFLNAVWLQIALVSYSIFAMIVAKNIDGLKVSRILEFYGKNSLIALGAHGPILGLSKRMVFKLYRVSNSVSGFVSTLITIGVLYLLILFLNRYMRVAVGKKSLFKF